MYLHKENKELFRDAVFLTSERMNVAADIVEKDYYVTMILKNLSKRNTEPYLKAVRRCQRRMES